MTIIGIDPHSAKPHSVAIMRDNAWIVKDMYLGEISREVASWKPDLVAIEDQYMMRHVGLKSLIQATGQLQGLCILFDTKYIMVNPAVWRSFFGLSKVDKANRSVLYRKEAVKHCNLKVSEDQAVAIMLCVYASRVST